MPELPEVETIRRQLHRELKGKTITDVTVTAPTMVVGSVVTFRRQLRKKGVIAVQRRGKYLLWGLTGGLTAVIHLKMTGQLVFKRGAKMRVGGHPIPGGTINLPNKYSHVIFHLSGGAAVYFNDQRRFGFVKVVPTDMLASYFGERGLGPEPLTKDFTEESLHQLTQRRGGTTIKQLLLDQKAIAGIGNIYAAEALFDARIKPMRRVKTLTRPEVSKLYRSIIKILKNAVAAQGTSADNYVDAYGASGSYVPKLKVYGRGGQKCLRCKSMLTAMQLAGRGTVYCKNCQK